MLLNLLYYEQLSLLILYILIIIDPITTQGLSCYKCMTTDPNSDGCQDPFSSIINPVQINCQVKSIFLIAKKSYF